MSISADCTLWFSVAFTEHRLKSLRSRREQTHDDQARYREKEGRINSIQVRIQRQQVRRMLLE
jgi:hypothetical protein